ncbi:MAG TPA: alpha/beta hydrolase [Solirubrobacteraceae bacterium]|nr:alpha/beta hydrolase [Solirubrobacteraceae bacterium]
MEFQTITEGGWTYVVSQAGEGPDIVLFHGFPDTPYSWSEIQAALVGAGWRVTVSWLRGYREETIVPGRRYDPETLGRDGLGVLDAIGVSRAVLVGHDWGALVTYVAAGLAPERVRGIVTCGIPHPSVLTRTPSAVWDVRHFFALKLPWAARTCRRGDFAYFDRLYRRWSPDWSGPEREETLRRAKEALSSPRTLDGAIAYYRDLPLGRQPAVLDHVPAVPGLIVGGDDALGQRGLFTRTAEQLQQPSRALIVDGTGHWPHRENAAVVVPELLKFLGEIGA